MSGRSTPCWACSSAAVKRIAHFFHPTTMPREIIRDLTYIWITDAPPANAVPARLLIPELAQFDVYEAGPNLYLSSLMAAQFVLLARQHTSYAAEVQTVLDALRRYNNEGDGRVHEGSHRIHRTSNGNWTTSAGLHHPAESTASLSRWSTEDDEPARGSSARAEPSGGTTRTNTWRSAGSRHSGRSRRSRREGSRCTIL